MREIERDREMLLLVNEIIIPISVCIFKEQRATDYNVDITSNTRRWCHYYVDKSQLNFIEFRLHKQKPLSSSERQAASERSHAPRIAFFLL